MSYGGVLPSVGGDRLLQFDCHDFLAGAELIWPRAQFCRTAPDADAFVHFGDDLRFDCFCLSDEIIFNHQKI